MTINMLSFLLRKVTLAPNFRFFIAKAINEKAIVPGLLPMLGAPKEVLLLESSPYLLSDKLGAPR
jgi:hypothetical protein